MKTNTFIITVVCVLILFAMISGCIEGYYKKTETVLVKLGSQENIQ